MDFEKIKKQVNEYYTGKILTYGPSPKGVDWNSEDSQELRFQQLLKVIDAPSSFSILDYGCGFGSMYKYMKKHYTDFSYTGFDISEAMIEEAKKLYTDPSASWVTGIEDAKQHDYVVASGIFNVKLENSAAQWQDYILDTLGAMNNIAAKGFSFNILTKYSDAEYMKDYLYYADPGFLLDHCKKNFSKYVAVLHDYPLYEFTVIVRK